MKKKAKQNLSLTANDKAGLCLNSIIEDSDSPAFFLDRDYCYISFNSAHALVMKQLYGMKIKPGMCLLECITVEGDRLKAKENLDQVLKRGEKFISEGYSGDEKRSRRYFEITHTPIKDDGGSTAGVAVIAHDITQRIVSTVLADAVETRYRELFDHISSGVAVYEAMDNGNDFIIRDFNDAASVIEKVTKEDVIGKSVLKAFPGVVEFGLFNVFQRVWETGKPEHFPVSQYKDQRITGWRDNYVYKLPSGEIVAVYSDMTREKQILEELELAKERLELALHGADLGLYDLNLTEGTFYGNQRYFELIGYQEGEVELTIERWKSLIHPEDLEVILKKFEEHVAAKNTALLEGEYRMRHKAGYWVWMLDRARIVGWDKKGNPVRLAGTHLDITGRKLVELALRQSEEKYRNIFENATEGIFQSTPEGRYITVNPSFARMAGYDSPADMLNSVVNIGRQLYANPGDRDRLKQLFEDPGYVRDFTAEIKRKDGSILWISINAKTVRDEEGKVLYYEGTTEDITERRQVLEALERQREEYRTIFDSVPAFIAYLDSKGTFLRVNRPAAAALGMTPRHMVGKTLFDIFPQEEAAVFFDIASKAFNSGIAVTGSINNYTTPTGETGWSENDIVPYYDSKRKIVGTILFAKDITDRMKAEHGLKLSYEALHQALEGSVNAIAKIVEMKDPYTAGHQARVAELAVAIAEELKLSEDRIGYIHTAARMHDVGKIYVPSDILSKPGKLTSIEFEIIKTHAQGSYDILNTIDFPGPIARIALQHHERLDGSGYPNGIGADAIIQEARILAVADVVEAMISYRPYRPALGIDKALEEIIKGKDKLYDGDAVNACVGLFQEKDFTFATPRAF
jgi:PAS domain S-box-containing protein